MATSPITSWQIVGKTVGKVKDFILGVSKITADADCSHEIKRRLLLGRKAMTNLNSILKSRDITLPTKVYLVKVVVFLVVTYEMWDMRYERWTIKKAECQRIDDFELWCWRRLKRPLDYKEIQPVHPKGDQSWVFIGRTESEAETPILWPYVEDLIHLKRPWCWERLKAGGEGGDRRWDGWMTSLTRQTWIWASSRSCWLTGRPGVYQSMEWQRVRHDWWLNWTEACYWKSYCLVISWDQAIHSVCRNLHYFYLWWDTERKKNREKETQINREREPAGEY